MVLVLLTLLVLRWRREGTSASSGCKKLSVLTLCPSLGRLLLALPLLVLLDSTHSMAADFGAEAAAATRTRSSRVLALAGASVVTISHIVTIKPDRSVDGPLRQQAFGKRGEGRERLSWSGSSGFLSCPCTGALLLLVADGGSCGVVWEGWGGAYECVSWPTI